MSAARFVCRPMLTSVSVVLMLASCAESNESAPPDIPLVPLPITADADVPLEDLDAGKGDSTNIVPDPSPPLQACSASTPCPIAVPVPIPSAHTLVAISGSGRNDVWAVGSSSTVLHFDGSEWKAPTAWAGAQSGQNTLRSIWLGRRDDVWLLDGSDVVHSNGWQGPNATQFERVETKMAIATDLGGYPGGAAWHLSRGEYGDANVLAHWRPWSNASTGVIETPIVNYGLERLLAISAPDANTIWGAGEGGKLFRVWRPDATSSPEAEWRSEEWNSHATTVLSDVSARDGEVWTVGGRGLVRRLGVDRNGLRRFLPVETGSATDLRAIHVFSVNDVWIVGDCATILHFDGTSWWRVPTPFENVVPRPTLHAVWGADANDVWFVGQGITLRLHRSD